jgi:hypothetical protein
MALGVSKHTLTRMEQEQRQRSGCSAPRRPDRRGLFKCDSVGLCRGFVAFVCLAILTTVSISRTDPALAASRTACPTAQPGFSATFWDPYVNWTPLQVNQDLAWQRQVGDQGIIVDWAVDQEANAAWYPDNIGYSYFEATIPTLVNAASASGQPLWMGLIVSPTLFQQSGNSWSFLEAEVPKFEAVADDLYRQYGQSISGWYIPTEPSQTSVSTYALSYQYGVWLRQIDDYLHTHDGNKKVMIAPGMPSAVNSGLTPQQFVQEMQPMMAVAHMDIWNFQDGFGMTGWTASQEAAGFALAKTYGAADSAAVWADIYTPPASSPSQWEPYLGAIAKAGVSVLTQWTFTDYMDPNNVTANANAGSDYSAYAAYCAR